MLANKLNLAFAAQGFDASTIGVKYATPNAFAHKLGVLQAVSYKTASFKAWNQSDAAATIRLKEGANVIASLNLAASAAGETDVDLAGISGAARLTVEIEVTTAGTGTGQVPAFLDVEQPVIVSQC